MIGEAAGTCPDTGMALSCQRTAFSRLVLLVMIAEESLWVEIELVEIRR
ncbi:hypothetical protein ABZ942_00035 [Nocardia sp. NPDC046473]